MIDKDILKNIRRDIFGSYHPPKAFSAAYRATNRWIEKNGCCRGKRMGNIHLKESVAIAREKYLLSFIANRDRAPEERFREVYTDETRTNPIVISTTTTFINLCTTSKTSSTFKQ
jgi:hypothetical protein